MERFRALASRALATSVAILGVVAASSVPVAPATTVLAGTLIDPVDGSGIAGATVTLGRLTATTDAAGGFRIETDKRRARPFPVAFRADGYAPYESWLAPGEERVGRVALFPLADVSVSDDPPVTSDTLAEHFDVVHRAFYDDVPWPVYQPEGTLARWVTVPEIVLVDHVVETVESESGTFWRATERRVTGTMRRRLRTVVREILPPLTDGFLAGDRVRIQRLRPGDTIVRDFDTLAPLGRLTIYAHEVRSTTGAFSILEDNAIVGAAVTVWPQHLAAPSGAPGSETVAHEIAHTLGMSHYLGTYPVTPLCSIMRTRCAPGHVSDADVVTARIAYSRQPGNDRQDRDPSPDSAARRTGRRVASFDGFRR